MNAELTKTRLRKGYVSIQDFRKHVESSNANSSEYQAAEPSFGENPTPEHCNRALLRPRWIRVNTLRTSLGEQLATTFSQYRTVDSIEQVVLAANELRKIEKLLHVDEHIPNLLAISQAAEISNTAAYRDGFIILQDKASCFPAYLLDPRPGDGLCLDACAAPGNKTTHLAALLQSRCDTLKEPKVWACERDRNRALILRKMIVTAGAEDLTEVKAGQDFLQLNPDKAPSDSISSLLLDPSCSGSGIVGREDNPSIILPNRHVETPVKANLKKRKRKATTKFGPTPVDMEEATLQVTNNAETHRNRLEVLSAFQVKLILHAFQFPKSRKITYSTCSIYAEENEHVIIRALTSSLARQKGWRILRRAEQVSGVKAWSIRGDVNACRELLVKDGMEDVDVDEVAEGCIRCEKGTTEGTQGFFVAAFTRNDEDLSTSSLGWEAGAEEQEREEGEEWEGCDN